MEASLRSVLAPTKIGSKTVRLLVKQGRADAIKYKDFADFTETHAITSIAAQVSQGQHLVNIWLAEQIAPLVTANEVLVGRITESKELIDRIKARPSYSGRLRKRRDQELETVYALIARDESQMEQNRQTGNTYFEMATEALASWVQHYRDLASVYTRARISASAKFPLPSSAAVPPFVGIPLIEIPEFDLTIGKGN